MITVPLVLQISTLPFLLQIIHILKEFCDFHTVIELIIFIRCPKTKENSSCENLLGNKPDPEKEKMVWRQVSINSFFFQPTMFTKQPVKYVPYIATSGAL